MRPGKYMREHGQDWGLLSEWRGVVGAQAGSRRCGYRVCISVSARVRGGKYKVGGEWSVVVDAGSTSAAGFGARDGRAVGVRQAEVAEAG